MDKGIYIFWFVGCNKIYIGSTKDFVQREYDHSNKLVNNRHNKKVNNVCKKYGIDNFRIELIEKVDGDEDYLEEREQHYLDNYCFATNAKLFRKHSLNICRKAYSIKGRKATSKTKRLMSKNRTGKGNHFYGKKHKQSSLDKMKAAKAGEIPSTFKKIL